MFVNTIRWRAGLALVTSPPTSTAVPSLTTPTETFVSSTSVNLDVALTDDWNQSGGSLIISGRLLTSAGQSYGSPNVAVALLLGPQTSPIALTLPFAVPIGGRARLTCHAGSPDGRQSTYVTVEATNPSFAPPSPSPATVLSVVVETSGSAIWTFDRPVAVVGLPTELVVGTRDVASATQAGAYAVHVNYTGGTIATGDPWTVGASSGTLTPNVTPGQSGTTV